MLHRGGEPARIQIFTVWTGVSLCGPCCMVPCCMLHGTTLHVACCMVLLLHVACCKVGWGACYNSNFHPCRLPRPCCTIGVGSLLHQEFPRFGLVSMCELFVGGTMVPCCTEVGSLLEFKFSLCGPVFHCVDRVAWYHVACCMVPRCMLHVAWYFCCMLHVAKWGGEPATIQIFTRADCRD